MDPINAISKVRFSSARPQRVHLSQDGHTRIDLLCLERQQEISLTGTQLSLYVITGEGTVDAQDRQTPLDSGHVLMLHGPCQLANRGEHRLVCLAFIVGG